MKEKDSTHSRSSRRKSDAVIYVLAFVMFVSITVVMRAATAHTLLDSHEIPLRAAHRADDGNLKRCLDAASDLRREDELKLLKSKCLDDNFASAPANAVSRSEIGSTTAIGYKSSLFIKNEQNGQTQVIAGSSTLLKKVRAIALNAKAQELTVLDGASGRILTFDLGTSGNIAPKRLIESPALTGASDIAIDNEHGEIYVADWRNSRILVFALGAHAFSPRPQDRQDVRREIRSDDLRHPTSLAVDPLSRKLYVLSAKENLMQVFDGTKGGEQKALQTLRGSGTRLNAPLTVEFAMRKLQIEVMNGDGEVLRYRPEAEGNEAPLKE